MWEINRSTKYEENKSHSYIKTFLWHVSASTVMKSKVIWNACCLLSCSSLTTEGLCLGGHPTRWLLILGYIYLGQGGGGGLGGVEGAGTDRCRVQVTAWELRLVPLAPHSTLRQSIFWGRVWRSCELEQLGAGGGGGGKGGLWRERGEKGEEGVAADPRRG